MVGNHGGNVPDLGVALSAHSAGRLDEAEGIYRALIEQNRRDSDAIHLLGVIHAQRGDFQTAVELIRRALTIKRTPDYCANLGNALRDLGRFDEAVTAYRAALGLNPRDANTQNNFGVALKRMGRPEEALAAYRAALDLNPRFSMAHSNLGNALQDLGRHEEAVAAYRAALDANPAYAEGYGNLGNALKALRRYDEALAAYCAALEINPRYAAAYSNMGSTLHELGRLEEAEAALRMALDVDPAYGDAHFNLSLVLLQTGRLAEGWSGYDWRLEKDRHRPSPRRVIERPLWNGAAPPSGKLLVWNEQGVGDEVMFAGLIPDVQRTGVPCVLECAPRLVPLFARSFPGVEVVARRADGEVAAQIPSGSLPRLFRPTLESFTATRSPYLTADPARRDALRARYADGRRLVGLTWSTCNRENGWMRTLDPAALAPLLETPGVRWVCLQYGDPDAMAREMAPVAPGLLIDREIDQLADLDAFAAQVAAMDLVVTIDNSTAHFAGALGVPTWVLLPHVADWRWLLEREDSPWYPTLRLLRQDRPGDWSDVVRRAARDLAAWSNG